MVEATNFIEQIINDELESGKVSAVQTRFPPEPNGYLHIGHAKSLCINFGMKEKYNGKCNLFFDDTNPSKEKTEFVDAIKADIKWLGFDWDKECYASDFFEKIYEFAIELIKKGKAFVCDMTPEEISANRGTLVEAGKESPFRNRSVEENLALAVRRGKTRSLKWGMPKKDREVYVEELAKLNLGLEERLSNKVGLLSGGQRQAITLLMATLNRPDLLLLDEHTAALDPKTAEKVLALTKQIVEGSGITTLMITHNMQDAITYGNRLIMMNAGKVIYDVSGEEKKNLTVKALLEKFEEIAPSVVASDKMVLSAGTKTEDAQETQDQETAE